MWCPGEVRIAGIGQHRGAQHPQQGGLARAVAAAQRDRLAGPNIRVDAVQNLYCAELLTQPAIRDVRSGRLNDNLLSGGLTVRLGRYGYGSI